MRILRQFLVITLAALVVEGQLLAEVPGARLLTTGPITVNGRHAPESSVLFNGDVVGAGADARAIIQQQRLAAYLGPGSQVKYLQSNGKNSVEVLSGATTVVLKSKNAGVVFRGLTARPKTGEAKAVIGWEHGRPALMASGGDLLVTRGAVSMTLLNGSALAQGAIPAQDPQTTGSTPAPAPAPVPEPAPAQTTTATGGGQDNDYCSEENQSKDKKRQKKCAGGAGQPASAFSDFHLIEKALIAGAILIGALFAFGAFSSNPAVPPCDTPPCPLLR